MVCLGFAFRFGVVASSLECEGHASSLNKCGSGGDRAEQVAWLWRLCRGGCTMVVCAVAVVAVCGGRGWQVDSGAFHHIREMGSAGIRVALFCGVI